MPRQNLQKLRAITAHHFRATQRESMGLAARFETIDACKTEDAFRRRSIMRAVKLGKARQLYRPTAARRLLKDLSYRSEGREPAPSLACSWHMRRLRKRIFTHLCRTTSLSPHLVTTFTLLKRGWEFTPEQLLLVDPRRLLAGLLSDLNRRGASDASGWLIAFLHGEYETPSGVFRLHVHGVAAGGMISVVDSLRGGPNYKQEPGDAVRFRVQIARRTLTDVAYSLTYCLKAYWPWKHVVEGTRGRRRTRGHKRIPEPYHTLVLLFLHRHAIDDLTLVKHLHVAGGELRLSRPIKGADA